jgi:hypothetical protein
MQRFSKEALNKFYSTSNIPSGAKEAAEKDLFPGEKCEKLPAGAKARHLFSATYGTTEVVP